ncbi:MAG: Ca-activated chloride channel family protein, partial [Halieaceae bacterium]
MVSLLNSALRKLQSRRKALLIALLTACSLAAITHPKEFVGLWLTPDQQGWLWFQRGDYAKAARSFEDPRWRGISQYAAQDFNSAAQYFSQYQDAASLLARGNALAHAREYLDARAVYRSLQQRFPDDPAPALNLPIVQALIDANRELSESQQSESGD